MAALPLLPQHVAVPGSVETFSSRKVDQAALGSNGTFRRIAVSPHLAGKSCLRPRGKTMVIETIFFGFRADFPEEMSHMSPLKKVIQSHKIRKAFSLKVYIVELWLLYSL